MATNSINDSVPWSPDLAPDGPDYDADDTYPADKRVSHDDPGDLYAGLPDIVVPKHRTS